MKKKIVIPVLIIVLLIGAVAAIAYFFDLNRFKPLISRTVRHYTGRELAINGDIRFMAYWPPTLAAEDITWQNAPWGSKPHMIRVKRAAFAVSLTSLLRGEFRFFKIRLEEPEVLLEFNRTGVSNFLLDIPETEGEVVIPVLAFRDIFIQNGYFEYNDQRWDLNASVKVNDIEADIPGLDKPMEILFEGSFRELPCSLEGSIGPIMAWIQPDNILPVDLSARLGKASARLKGEIRDPVYLKDISLFFTANGPSTREMAGLIHRADNPELGSFTVKAKLTDRSGLLAIEKLSANIGSPEQVFFSASGRIGNLYEMKGFDLDLGLQTPHIGNLMLLANLPPPPFEAPLSANVTFSDIEKNRYRLDDVFVDVGNNAIHGRMEVDLSGVRPALDMQLQAEHAVLGPFALNTRMSGSLDRVSVEHLELAMGHDNLFKAYTVGAVGSLSPLRDLYLNFHILGNDLANLEKLTGRPLPVHGPYVLSGALSMADHQTIQVPELKIILNRNSVSGSLGLELAHEQPILHGNLASNRLNLERLLKPATLPEEFQASLSSVGPSRLTFQLSGPLESPELNSIEFQTRVENLATLNLTGSVKNLLDITGTDLQIAVKGSDIVNLGQLVGHDIPFTGPYSLSGRLRTPDAGSYLLENLKVTTIRNTFEGQSNITFSESNTVASVQLGANNVSLEALVKGQNAILDRLRTKRDLGPLAFQASVVLSAKASHLQTLDLAFGKDDFARILVKGSVGNLSELKDLRFDFQVSGREISNLESIAGRTIPVNGPYELSGEVSGHVPENIMLRNLGLMLKDNHITGRADLNLAGDIPAITAEIKADRFSLAPVTIEKIEPLKEIPDLGPLRLAFKLEENNKAPALTNLDFHLGRENTILTMLNGTVGNLNPIGDVSLDFEVHSQDLSILKNAFDIEYIKEKPFHIVGRLHDPRLEKVTVTSLQASYGDSDLSGTADLDLTGDRPSLIAHLSSHKLDLRPFIEIPFQNSSPDQAAKPSNRSGNRLFAREPFDVTLLQQVNAHVTFQGKEILFKRLALNDIDIQLKLNEGDLNVDPLRFNIGDGTAEGSFALKAGSTPPFMATSLAVHHFETGPMLEQLGKERTIQGTLNTTIYLNGRGNSVAALMAGLNGKVQLDIHDGQIESKQLALLERYLGSSILDVINPFIRQPPHTTINCLISTTTIKDGQAEFNLILDTEQTALASAGTIDLKTEGLDIAIKPSPKKGFGDSHVGYISFSLKELSQPFGLGGTIMKPQLVLDPGRTIITAAKFAGAVFIGPVGMTLFFTDISLGKKNICEEATQAMRKK